jgi:hypothetical protein
MAGKAKHANRQARPANPQLLQIYAISTLEIMIL